MSKLRAGNSEINLTLAVGPATSPVPTQEVTFSGSVTVIFDLESGSNLQFVSRADSPEAAYIDELATDVWLMGDIKARFRAWAVWQEWYQNGQDNVSVMAVTYKKLLNRRHVCLPPKPTPEDDPPMLTFDDTDMGLIVWGMWEHTQSLPGGDLGVTLGTPNTTGIVRTRTYKQGENLGQQADAEYEEGIWWTIDENLVYTAGDLASRPFLGTPLHLGVNVRSMQRASGDFANAIYGDADEASTIGVWAVDPDIATDPRGRWETAVGWPTVTLQETLADRTAAQLSAALLSVAHWNIDIEPSRWVTDSQIMPGDHAVLVVPRSLAAPLGQPTPLIAVLVTQVVINFTDSGAFEVKAVVMEQPHIPVSS